MTLLNPAIRAQQGACGGLAGAERKINFTQQPISETALHTETLTLPALSPRPVVWLVLLANAAPLMPNATAMAEATSVFFMETPTVE